MARRLARWHVYWKIGTKKREVGMLLVCWYVKRTSYTFARKPRWHASVLASRPRWHVSTLGARFSKIIFFLLFHFCFTKA